MTLNFAPNVNLVPAFISFLSVEVSISKAISRLASVSTVRSDVNSECMAGVEPASTVSTGLSLHAVLSCFAERLRSAASLIAGLAAPTGSEMFLSGKPVSGM
jgi:hypothetical protein